MAEDKLSGLVDDLIDDLNTTDTLDEARDRAWALMREFVDITLGAVQKNFRGKNKGPMERAIRDARRELVDNPEPAAGDQGGDAT